MKRHTFHLQKGSTTALVVVSLAGMISVVGVSLSLATTANKGAVRGADRFQAQLLAESGARDLYAQIRRQMNASGEYSMTLASTTLKNSDGYSVGAYEGRVIEVLESSQDIDRNGARIRQTNYTFVLEGTGTTEKGMAGRVRTRFTAVTEHGLKKIEKRTQTADIPTQIYYPVAAMSSNQRITFETKNKLTVSTKDNKSAHILANDGIIWESKDDRDTYKDLLDFSGQVVVHKSAYEFTGSTNGLGIAKDKYVFTSPAADAKSDPNQLWFTEKRINFADEKAVAAWDARWRKTTTAADATVYDKSVSTTSLTAGPSGKTLSAPMYIDGDLTVAAGETLKLMPTSSNPAKNFIYVTGDVKNLGALQNLGVKIVVVGKYEEDKKAKYEVTEAGSPFSTRQRVLQNSALLSMAKASDAISLSGKDHVTTGLVYSLLGGIKIDAPNAKNIGGAFVAGGSGNDGGISVTSKSGSVKFNFEVDATKPAELNLSSLDKIDISYEKGSTVTAFTPQRPTNWSVMSVKMAEKKS
jgi:hypothetical protein